MGVCVVNRSDLVEAPCDRAECARLRAVSAPPQAAPRSRLEGYASSRGEVFCEDIRRLEAAIARATEVTT